jgi:hypothetical protein
MTVTAPQVLLRYGEKVLDCGSDGVFRHHNPYSGWPPTGRVVAPLSAGTAP